MVPIHTFSKVPAQMIPVSGAAHHGWRRFPEAALASTGACYLGTPVCQGSLCRLGPRPPPGFPAVALGKPHVMGCHAMPPGPGAAKIPAALSLGSCGAGL